MATTTTRPPADVPTRRKPVARAVVRYVLLVLLAALFISPLVYMVVTSFKTRGEAAGFPPTWVPTPPTTAARH